MARAVLELGEDLQGHRVAGAFVDVHHAEELRAGGIGMLREKLPGLRARAVAVVHFVFHQRMCRGIETKLGSRLPGSRFKERDRLSKRHARNDISVLGREIERGTACDENRQVRADPQEVVHLARRRNHTLEVVQNQQGLWNHQAGVELLQDGDTWFLLDPQRGRDGMRHLRRIGDGL